MATLVVQPKDPRDVRPEELVSLVGDLREELSGVAPEVAVVLGKGDDDHCVGVTFVEVVRVVLDGIGGVSGLLAIRDAFTRAAAKWTKRRSAEKGDLRPRTVVLYGPDNREISKVTLEDEKDEPRIIHFDEKP